MKQHVVIIGAGIGGIATANLLAKAGYKVSVFEKNSRAGGRAGTFTEDGFRFDTGPSWYLMPEVFEHYYALCDTTTKAQLDLVQLTPAYKVFFEQHAPVTITSDPKIDAKTFEAIEPGAGEKLNTYVQKGDEIYRLALKHFLYTNFESTQDFLKKEVLKRSATMLKLAALPIDPYVRRYVTDLRLRQILEYPMVFLGSSPFSAPALYSLMSALDFREGVFYPQGGIYTIIESLLAISEKLDVTYHFNAPVRHIHSQHGRADYIELEDGRTIAADIVISNADLHFTETALLKKADQSFPTTYWKKKEAGPSALLMYLGVKGNLPQLEHHNLFFIDDWKENFEAIFSSKQLPHPASIYLCKTSATDPTAAPKDHENIFVLVPLPAGITLSQAELKTAAQTYLKQIAKHFNVPDLQKRIVYQKTYSPNDFGSDYNSWQNTALGPSHILRQSAFFRTPNKSKKLRNLYYVGGSTTPGIGLPMCLIGAELIYKRLAGSKMGGPVAHIETLDTAKHKKGSDA